MYILYGLLFLMLVVALSVIALPFLKKRPANVKGFILFSVLFAFVAIGLYQVSGSKLALQSWLNQGELHYQLLETFQALGGVDGAIERIQKKLDKNPNDAQGWVILGKLYLSKQEIEKAKAAFNQAHQLQPQNPEINKLYGTRYEK